jgi:membrane-associated phospholipid phosphatase
MVGAVALTCVAVTWVLTDASLARLDRTLQPHLYGRDGTIEVSIARALTRIGIGVLLIAVLVMAGLVVRARSEGWVRRGGWGPVAIPALAVAIGSTLSTLVKSLVQRARPPTDGWLSYVHGSSFPSGHMTASTAGYLALALVVAGRARTAVGRFVAIACGVAMSLAIGWTRVVLGVHWPSDVLAGFLLGTAAACLAVLIWPPLEARLQRRERV